jgi:hypothetical protein
VDEIDIVKIATVTPGTLISVGVVTGFNLLGNGYSAPITVATTLGDATKIITVWKWIVTPGKWAFYTPTLGDGGAAYAASHGYDFLTSISGGEGFWVNATIPFTLQIPSGAPIASTSFNTLPSGFSLIAVGDAPTPRAFNIAIGPGTGATPPNLNTLWTWEATQTTWYFYSPILDAAGTLASYIISKGYLDFGAKTLDPGLGFWVNKQ